MVILLLFKIPQRKINRDQITVTRNYGNMMNIDQYRLQTLSALILTLAAASAWSQSDASTLRAGVVKIVNGDVRVRDGQGERALKSGDAVIENARLMSGKEGTASMILRDGTTLVLGNNSQFEVQKFAFDATTQNGNIFVNLLQGSMRMLTGLIAKANPESIQVKTKTLSVGIRGTDFIVETEEKP
jgi:hypothetical protein